MLSYVFLGIYWNNHHHMLHAGRRASTARVLWANLHLLFWLSLVPFATGWMGENHFAALPTAVYGVVLLCSAVAYLILQHAIVGRGPQLEACARRSAEDCKGKVSFAAVPRRDSAGVRAHLDRARDLTRSSR